MKQIAAGVMCFALAGCLGATMPGAVKQQSSTFDGTTELVMEPGLIYSGPGAWSYGHFSVGLFWKSDMPEGQVLFIAKLPRQIMNIASEDGLQFNIDGEIVSLDSPEIFTEFETTEYIDSQTTDSRKRFVGSIDLVQRMLAANSVKVKLNLAREYLEGDFKADKPSAAIRGFRKFLEQYQLASAK